MILWSKQYPAGWKFRWILQEGYNNNINLELAMFTNRTYIYTLLILFSTFASSSTTSNALSCFPTTDGEDSVEYNWPSLSAGRRKRQKFTRWTTLTMDAAILNIYWLAKDWGEDLAGTFSGWGRTGRKRRGGARGGDLAVLRGDTGG